MGEEGEDDDEEFRLPINHVIENSLDTDKIEMASQVSKKRRVQEKTRD